VAIMFGVAVWTASRRLKGFERAGRAVALACGAGAVVAIGLICGLPILDRSVRTLVAVSGIVVGGTMTAATLTGRRLLDGLRRRREEIEGWLALGATPRQAVLPIAREAASEALVPAIDQTRTVGLVTLPGAFVGVLLGGASPVQAGITQVLVLVGLLTIETGAVLLVVEFVAAGLIRPDPMGAAADAVRRPRRSPRS